VYTIIVFALVCGMVLLGMYLSYREFELSANRRLKLVEQLLRRLRRKGAAAPSQDEMPDAATELEISAWG